MIELQIDLTDFLRDQSPNGAIHLVSRRVGEVLRQRIEEKLIRSPEVTIAYLSFSKVGIVDFSGADEAVAKLMSRLVGGEYGDRYIVLRDLSEGQRENIEVALERKRLAALGKGPAVGWELLGILNNYLRETLDFVMRQGEVTARQMAEVLHLKLNTSGTRLLNLYNARLVVREEKNVSPAGRQFIYRSVFGTLT